MTAANTKHGNFSANARADKPHVRTFTSRNRLVGTATPLWPYLPPDLAARLARGPDELFAPVHLSNLLYLTPQDAMPRNVKTRAGKPAPRPTGGAAERLAVRAEATAQAPWREAIVHARGAKRAVHQARTTWRQKQAARRNAVQRENAPPPGARPTAATPAAPAIPAPTPATWQDLTQLQRKLAARLADLRGPRFAQPPSDATRGQQAGSTNLCTKSAGRIAVHREPTAHPVGTKPPTTRPSAPSGPTRPASQRSSVPTTAHPLR